MSWAREMSEIGKTRHEALEHSANEISEKRQELGCGHMDEQASQMGQCELRGVHGPMALNQSLDG